MNMKSFVVGVIIAVGLAPVASADDASYLAAMRQIGAQASDVDIIQLGHDFCDAMRLPMGGIGGLSPGGFARHGIAERLRAMGLSERGLAESRLITSNNLCPDAW